MLKYALYMANSEYYVMTYKNIFTIKCETLQLATKFDSKESYLGFLSNTKRFITNELYIIYLKFDINKYDYVIIKSEHYLSNIRLKKIEKIKSRIKNENI